MEIQSFLRDFREYIGTFEYDLIIVSHKRIAIINQDKRQYIEYHDEIMMIDILECFCSSKTCLQDAFDDVIIKFSTDDYLKLYLSDLQQVV